MVTGDFARLVAFRQRLQRIAAGGLTRTLMPRLATEAHRQALGGFAAQRDPYGRSWAPRRPPPAWVIRAFGLMQQNHPILDKTRAAINSLRVQPNARGMKASIRGYMVFHQRGTVRLPIRRIFPDQALGLGPIWGEAFVRVAGDVLREALA